MENDWLQKGDWTYLGDALYVRDDGLHIWLKTERENGWHFVALDPQVLSGLFDFIREKRELDIKVSER